MPRRRDSDDEPAGLGLWAGAKVLKAAGHAFLIAAGAMGLAALLGSTVASIGGAAVAFGVGMAATAGADVLRSKAVQATQHERREREDEIELENAAVDAAVYAMEAEQARSGHVERLLRRQREPQARSTGKGV